jgi:hypothetical protein
MRRPKLKLDVDELVVESLRMPRPLNRNGTVRANELIVDYHDTVYRPTVDPSSWNDTVLRNTEWISCGGTCGTCGGTDCWA